MWGEYFKNATIIGVDIDHNCKIYEEENRQIVIKDLSNWKSVSSLASYNPTIIVDDASHIWSHQIKALFALFPKLKSGGIYILEDLETSFRCYDELPYQDTSFSPYEVLSAVGEIVTSRELLNTNCSRSNMRTISHDIEALAECVDMISFIHGSCILVKR